ncbi:MAG: iron-containing alcohol dehydrogenase [Solirubrobacterales bacterium]
MAGEFPFDQDEFQWRDGDRTILFGDGVLDGAPKTLAERGWDDYELLSTARALETAPAALAENASKVHEVASGPVPEISLPILDQVESPNIVAHGGGRVIDSAKAIAAVLEGRVCAIPTTLSGAPMTVIHRLPEGKQAPGLHRPPLVIADPTAMTGQPESERRASAMNALAHGADSLYTPLASPVSRMAALHGAALIAGALDTQPPDDARTDLALGALLCAYSIDSALFSLHHVICQTLVRVLGTAHAETNAAILLHSLEALRPESPPQSQPSPPP